MVEMAFFTRLCCCLGHDATSCIVALLDDGAGACMAMLLNARVGALLAALFGKGTQLGDGVGHEYMRCLLARERTDRCMLDRGARYAAY